jgi:uncharacterized protein YndB with AHSA1/START domain
MAEVPLSTVSMDVRPGGAWRATMFAGPDRREIQWKGEYLEVVEPERLVFTVSPEQYERAGQGWPSFFDRIAERLAEA